MDLKLTSELIAWLLNAELLRLYRKIETPLSLQDIVACMGHPYAHYAVTKHIEDVIEPVSTIESNGFPPGKVMVRVKENQSFPRSISDELASNRSAYSQTPIDLFLLIGLAQTERAHRGAVLESSGLTTVDFFLTLRDTFPNEMKEIFGEYDYSRLSAETFSKMLPFLSTIKEEPLPEKLITTADNEVDELLLEAAQTIAAHLPQLSVEEILAAGLRNNSLPLGASNTIPVDPSKTSNPFKLFKMLTKVGRMAVNNGQKAAELRKALFPEEELFLQKSIGADPEEEDDEDDEDIAADVQRRIKQPYPFVREKLEAEGQLQFITRDCNYLMHCIEQQQEDLESQEQVQEWKAKCDDYISQATALKRTIRNLNRRIALYRELTQEKEQQPIGEEKKQEEGIDDLLANLENLLGQAGDNHEPEEPKHDKHAPKGETNMTPNEPNTPPKGKTPMLKKFGTDITQKAQEHKLDPVIGREREISRMEHILARRRKNNPVLIGEPGVGKSAIVEGLAQRIVSNRVSRSLIGKRIIEIDLSAMLAGTQYRGQFEERFKGLMKEVTEHPEVILFFDEIHTIMGAGSTSDSDVNASNMIKPALARGEVRCIGATTLDEYRKSIEKDGAMERRFQKIIVDPSSREETLEILSQLKEVYGSYHGVEYSPEAIKAAVELTDRYISDRAFPDKAIDALDEAGANVKINQENSQEILASRKNIEAQAERLAQLSTQKLSAVKEQNYELAASLKLQEDRLKEQLAQMESEWQQETHVQKALVSAQDVAQVVALMTGVPTEKIATAENSRLRLMSQNLKSKVIGQDEAIDKLVKAIQRNRLGLRDENRPIGSFLFIGPTGVGKTYLAKKLSEELFDNKDSVIRVDMSEYMEKYSVSRLIGAPPGYVGYEEGGELTEKVRRKPYSVVLIDEIEKAHPDVYNVLLQVLDDGILTDSLGRKVDFKNTVIIITSNVGTKKLGEHGAALGYRTSKELTPREEQSLLMGELKKFFRPEFLNRLDELIVFNRLTGENLRRIVDLELAPIIERVQKQGYTLLVTDQAKDKLANEGFDVQYGARPLRRTLQSEVENALTDLILNEEVNPGDRVVLGVVEDKFSMHTDPNNASETTPQDTALHLEGILPKPAPQEA